VSLFAHLSCGCIVCADGRRAPCPTCANPPSSAPAAETPPAPASGPAPRPGAGLDLVKEFHLLRQDDYSEGEILRAEIATLRTRAEEAEAAKDRAHDALRHREAAEYAALADLDEARADNAKLRAEVKAMRAVVEIAAIHGTPMDDYGKALVAAVAAYRAWSRRLGNIQVEVQDD
jgi:hypothetical protein